MIKALHGTAGAYVAGQRSLHWLKLKRDYISGLGDTIDLVQCEGTAMMFIGSALFAFMVGAHKPTEQENV